MTLQPPTEIEAKPVLHNGIVESIDASRQRQLSFYDEECDPEFEISRPYGCGRLCGLKRVACPPSPCG